MQHEPRADTGAEMKLIGAIMGEPRALDDIFINPEDFYRPAHEELWKKISAQIRAGKPADPLTMSHLIGDIPGVDAVYLHQCFAQAPHRGVAPHYAEIVVGLARLRRMADVGQQLIQQAQTSSWEDAETILDAGRATLDETVSQATGVTVTTFAKALELAVDEWQAPEQQKYKTGWSELDRKLNGGWRGGQLTVVGARPAVGKSVIASCAAVAAHGYGVGFFSLEMSMTEVVSRMAASAQGIDLGRLNSGNLTDIDWQRVSRLAQRSQDWRVYIEDKSRLTMAQIRATVRTWTRKGPLPLVIIDYSQLVTPADRTESRERQVSRILEDCKHLAKEFDTHVLALAQVNRGSTHREDKRPTMADLRESGGIEAHADNIILLHRDEATPDEIELILAKNRHGPNCTINLVWRPSFASANSMASDIDDYRHGMENVI
jgi:replicative DNA helicase